MKSSLPGGSFFVCFLLSMPQAISGAQIDSAVEQAVRTRDRVRLLLLLRSQPHARAIASLGPAALQRRVLEARYRSAVAAEQASEAAQTTRQIDRLAQETVAYALRLAAAEMSNEQAVVEEHLRSLGATHMLRFMALNLVRAEVPSERLEELASHPLIAHIGLVEQGEAQINVSVRTLGSQAFWNGTPQITGSEQSLAMLDSGVYAHPAIRSTITHARFLTPGSIACSEAGDYNDNQDRSGHGTHVAGVIASQGTPAFAGYLGVAFRLANLYSIKVACRTADSLVPTNLALYADDDLLLGLQHVVTQTPARIVNISLGKRDRDGDSAFLRAIDLMADTYGLTIVASAGNYGPLLYTLTAPGAAYNVITVGAFNTQGTEPRDDDRPAGFSSRGPTADGRRKPDLSAPGGYADNMISQRPLQPCSDGYPGACGIYSTAANSSGFVPLPGTSAAAAHVSGSTVLLREIGVTNPLAVKALLINSTDTVEWAPNVGWGYLNLNVLRAAYDRYLLGGVRRGGFNLYRATVNGVLNASLVWNRRIGQGGTASLDNLDLLVYNATDGGQVAASESALDNVEKASATSLNGDYVVKVRNATAPDAAAPEQTFALATTVRGFALINGPALSISCSGPFVAPPSSAVVITCIARNSGDAPAFQVQGVLTFQTNTQPLSFGTLAPGARITRSWTITAPAVLSAYSARVDLSSMTFGESYTASVAINFFTSNCTYSVTVDAASFPAAGGTGTIQVATQPGCPVSIAGNVPWIVAQAGNRFTVMANSGGARTGSLSVCGELIQILQRAPSPASAFVDVAVTNPFADYIGLLRDNSVTTGCSASTYCPDDNTTRGQMAVFLVRSVLRTDDFAFPLTRFFEDVGLTHPQFRHIQKLRDLGITSGCSSIEYCPELLVTRGQMAVFLVRSRLGIGPGDAFSYRSAPYFEDVPATHPFFAYIQKLRELGITTGCGANLYCPDGWTTRGQMAVFLIRGLFTP